MAVVREEEADEFFKKISSVRSKRQKQNRIKRKKAEIKQKDTFNAIY